ncbi:MAG TPA: hypothetical protein VHE34_08060 [Puia sp.]|uniref:hypothetical protein n=1 Tax=Puia sp. TaxID=2045100 RepID=UPI002BB92D37|nr:hypothetical protein [Puia sp.]HVU95161.1 hypothetical protein [Puia sp.]
MTMNPKRLLCPTILLGLILSHPPAAAQQAILAYTGSSAAEWRLYNGPLYLGYDHHAQGHPFFGSGGPQPGAADYDGIFFPALNLSYDLVKDIVIIPDKQKSAYVQLLTEKLTAFSLGEDKFIYLPADSTATGQPTAGYYQLLYNGKARALAKHWKQVQNNGKAEENLTIYRQYDSWYLEMNNRYLLIHSQKSLLKAFGAGDKGLRNILHSKNISFKKDPVAALTAAAELLSQSNK